MDALKGPVYKDDSQVKILWTYKEFLEKSQESYYRFSVTILDGHKSRQILQDIKQFQRETERS